LLNGFNDLHKDTFNEKMKELKMKRMSSHEFFFPFFKGFALLLNSYLCHYFSGRHHNFIFAFGELKLKVFRKTPAFLCDVLMW